MTTYPTPRPLRARIEIEMGDIRVVADADGESVVEVVPTDPSSEKDRRTAEQTRITCTDDRLDVMGPKRSALIGPTRKTGSVQVTVHVPAGSAVEASTSLGVVATEGPFDEIGAKTSAGDVHVQQAGTVDLRTGLGAVTVGAVSGDARCTTSSGSIRIDRVGGNALVKNSNGDTWIGDAGPSTRVKSANGTIAVDRARGDVMATTANGDLRIGCAERGQVMLRTSLGRIELGIPHGTAARLGLRTSFGSVRNALDAADGPASGDRTLEVDAQTSAGDIDIVRAALDVDGAS
ncbi:MAG TPA: DUF4097 family beta strand repeat-containing protein [Candidatus Nanopelagicales bacterium]|nr:DUF4097 family beta strand repeat-containing protein [Candidatus Nanopelagicales bacterium]